MNKKPKKTKDKLSLKKKFALALFMECVPMIIDLWKRSAPDVSLDEFLLSEYEKEKNRKSKSK